MFTCGKMLPLCVHALQRAGLQGYLLHAAPKRSHFLRNGRGYSSDLGVLVSFGFFLFLPQLLMVSHHHSHHLASHDNTTIHLKHVTSLILHNVVVGQRLAAYLSGHASLPSPLLGKVSREPLHLLTQVFPVNFGPLWLRQSGETLHGPEALSLQCLGPMLDICLLQDAMNHQSMLIKHLCTSGPRKVSTTNYSRQNHLCNNQISECNFQ